MSYGITGWTPGGDRQSLTYSLKAGQKRGMGRANIVSNNIVINNFGAMPRGIDMYDVHHHCDNSLSGFEKWTLGIGTGLGALGTILGAILGGGSAEGAGDSGQKAEDTVEEKTEPKPDAKPQISEKQQKSQSKKQKLQILLTDKSQRQKTTYLVQKQIFQVLLPLEKTAR